MRFLHANNQHSDADDIIKMLIWYNILCTPETRMLDFGCGSGRLVYEFREKGYNCDGFDIADTVRYKTDPATGEVYGKEYFNFTPNGPTLQDPSNYIIEDGYHLPFEDNSYDLVFSTGVIEHITNLDQAMAEIRRVLRPKGVALHFFPTWTFPIERHIHVPFASYFSEPWYPWLLFWARMGVRIEGQKGLPAEEVAKRNLRYCTTGLRYESDRTYRETSLRFFEQARLWNYSRKSVWWKKNWKKVIAALCSGKDPLTRICSLAEHRFLFTAFPKGKTV